MNEKTNGEIGEISRKIRVPNGRFFINPDAGIKFNLTGLGLFFEGEGKR